MGFLFITLLSAALDTGLAFAHALEMTPKMDYDASQYLLLHRTLYWGFGTIGAVIDVAVLPLTIGLACKLRHDRASFRATLFAAVCYVLAFALWVTFVNPANTQMKAWSLGSPPERLDDCPRPLGIHASCALWDSVGRPFSADAGDDSTTA